MKFNRSLFIVLALCLLTACGLLTEPSNLAPQAIKIAPQPALAKCQELETLPEKLDLGQLVARFSEVVALYNRCRSMHDTLVDYEAGRA